MVLLFISFEDNIYSYLGNSFKKLLSSNEVQIENKSPEIKTLSCNVTCVDGSRKESFLMERWCKLPSHDPIYIKLNMTHSKVEYISTTENKNIKTEKFSENEIFFIDWSWMNYYKLYTNGSLVSGMIKPKSNEIITKDYIGQCHETKTNILK